MAIICFWDLSYQKLVDLLLCTGKSDLINKFSVDIEGNGGVHILYKINDLISLSNWQILKRSANHT